MDEGRLINPVTEILTNVGLEQIKNAMPRLGNGKRGHKDIFKNVILRAMCTRVHLAEMLDQA